MGKRKKVRLGPSYRCQCCGYFGSGWKNGRQDCPKCGVRYDWLAAQDLEDAP